MTVAVPVGPADITPDWIRSLSVPGPEPDSPVEIVRIGADFGLSSKLYRVAWGDADHHGSVVVKLWATNALMADAPETLLHADLHLDHVLFEENGTRPVILDWARVARGPEQPEVGGM